MRLHLLTTATPLIAISGGINTYHMRNLVLLLLVLGFSAPGQACDICGCSANGAYFGVLPQFQRHFIGMRWQYRTFTSAHPSILQEIPDSKQTYHTFEAWGRFYPHPRIQVIAFVPYHIFQQRDENGFIEAKGLGDVIVAANYDVVHVDDGPYRLWKHQWLIGGGVKLPTGHYNAEGTDGQPLSSSLQTGTGSFDFMINSFYTLRYKRWGASADLSYRFNTANSNDFRYGDRFSGTLRFFYWKEAKGFSWLPHAGATIEMAAKDVSNKYIQPETGGYTLWGNLGLESYVGKVTVGATLQLPMLQDISNGAITAHGRLMLNVSYLF